MRWAAPPILGTSDFSVAPITATGTRRAGPRVSLHRDRCSPMGAPRSVAPTRNPEDPVWLTRSRSMWSAGASAREGASSPREGNKVPPLAVRVAVSLLSSCLADTGGMRGGSMSIRSLPPRPNLATVKKQSKQLLRLHRTDPDSVRMRIQEHHPRPGAFGVLADAQLVVAREYGFASWRRLSEHIEELTVVAGQGELARFLDLACLTYGDDSTARIDRAKRMLAARPSLATADTHTAAATASVEALRRLIGEDRGRASATGGPRNWPPLLYLCYSRVTEQLPRRRHHRHRPTADRARRGPECSLHVGAHVPVHGPHRRDGRRRGRRRQPATSSSRLGPCHVAARRRGGSQ